MKILLSDGSGLTSRQVATILGRAGHRVEVLDSAGFALTHQTRWVSAVHRVPPVGADPFAWLTAAAEVMATHDFDLLLPTQEQVTALSACPGVVPRTVGVPAFAALRQVQDKISAAATLDRLGLPRPPSSVVTSRAALLATRPPVFIKRPIGTASSGVRHAGDATQLRAIADALDAENAYADGILAEHAVEGELLMVQSVFSRGELVAWHACRRRREGSKGGASGKVSDPRPELESALSVLGSKLGWHGALSADAVLTTGGPLFIDINPRIVEPFNALRSGVDLIAAMLELRNDPGPAAQATGHSGVRTHQLLLALTHAGDQGRRFVARELAQASTGRGPYRDSTEELTPLRGDARTAILIGGVAAALLVAPRKMSAFFTGGAVASYALTPDAWGRLIAANDNESEAPDADTH